MADTDTDTMHEPGTIDEARRIVGSHWVEAVLLGADDIIALARLALAEHERAETLARRVAELEAQMQWIPHGGGPQPVDGAVWIRNRGGAKFGPVEANLYRWRHLGAHVAAGVWDIVAYRTTDPSTETGKEAANADD